MIKDNPCISRSGYFAAMAQYDSMVKALKIKQAPDFRLFMPTVPFKDAIPIPFKHSHYPMLIELTPDGYRHHQWLSNPYSVTLLAIWIAQHGS